ncbi:uncharacterized protein LOC131215432 [Anopheles bellator]|uniref:uncharacterized protein LOC131215432 n=1 Tax=Anopheles bellator TaxID=139047 RepID=UPI002648EE8E|nr:uncharacterized protein LOC131215432 [Anopheles bellator]
MWLFGFLFTVILCVAKCTEGDVSVEAAFQGRCGHGSPCEQLCYELHDGMYECDCSEGFELHRNGYSCQEINSTSSDDNSSNGEEDVLYQRGASFSAKLDISDLHISMKSYDDGETEVTDDDTDAGGEVEVANPSNRLTASKGRRPPITNPNSIVGSELARRKTNHNWKTEASKQSSNANDAWSLLIQAKQHLGKSSRNEKSVHSDAGPSMAVASTSNRHDHQPQRAQQQTPQKPSGNDRRKSNTTDIASGGGVTHDGGRSNMPLAGDMEISGISLHSPVTDRGNEADVASSLMAQPSASRDVLDASEIRALPLSMATSMEEETGGLHEAKDLIPQKVMLDNLHEQGSRLISVTVEEVGRSDNVENSTLPLPDGTVREPCTFDCGPEGVCHAGVEGTPFTHCLCPFGKSGNRCEEDTKVNTPRFNKRSWVAFPALRGAYKHVQLHVEFRPESFDGVLLLTGERDDLTGDFMALLLHQGFVEFWFDCGSGMGRVKSEETIVLNQWNTITIYRHRWDAWLVLNQGNRVQGRSKGLFSRITFREPVFLGGYGNITGLDRKLPVSTGFTGCIRKFVTNDHDYNFQQTPLGDVSHGFDIQECITDRCSRYPCQHGGKCLPSDDGAICLCPLGFGGDLCEMRLDLQVPSFNGSSYLRYAPLGDSCIIWFELKIIIKPLLEDGLLLYSGHHEYGDYISLCLNMGFVEFTYDLGSGPATVRSEFSLTMGQWHTIKVSRTSRLAVLKIDQLPEVMTVSPNGFWHLSLPHSLYLGGVHNVHTLPMSLRDKGAFAGCIQKVDINDRTISIISEALGGSNVENCPHACVARPCGPLAKCVPNLDTYECQCNPQNQQCNKAEELPSEVIERQQRLLLRKQQQQEQQLQRVQTTATRATATVPAAPEDSTLPHDNNPSDGGEVSSEEASDGTYNDYYEDGRQSGEEEKRKSTPASTPSAGTDPNVDPQRVGQDPFSRRQSNDEVVPETHSRRPGYGGHEEAAANESLVSDRYHRTAFADDEQAYAGGGVGDALADIMLDGGTERNHRATLVTELAGFGERSQEHSAAKQHHNQPSRGTAPKVGGGTRVVDKDVTVASVTDSGPAEQSSTDEDADSNGSDEAYDSDGNDKDYEQHGDRIPYRPDFLLHRPTGWRGRKARPDPAVPGSLRAVPEPEIDESLIEEMNRIMKNHNDAADDAESFWGVTAEDDESGTGTRTDRGEASDINDEDEVPVSDDDHYGGQHHPGSHHRRRNGAEPIFHGSAVRDWGRFASSHQQSQLSPGKSGDEFQDDEDDGDDGDDVLRSVKYKNKYFRKYQGACFTGTDSYFHYSDAETMRRVISYEIDLNLRFKTHSSSGLILWTGRHSALEGDDFLSLGIENGFLHLRYNLGSGEINIKYNATKVSDGLWHRVRALRNSQDGTLKVDGGKPITRRSPGKLRQLNTDTGLYVGGLPAAVHYTRQRYRSGIMGCISELILAGELRLSFDATILGTAHNVEPGAP